MTEPEGFDELLAQAWQTFSPPAGLASRVQARLAASSASKLASSPRTGRHLQGKLRALRASGGVGGSAAALLLGLGFAAGYLARADEPPLPPQVAPASAAAPPASATADAAHAAALLPARSAPAPAPENTTSGAAAPARAASAAPKLAESLRAPRARRTPPARPSPARGANDELQLLERAERALRARHPELALALTDELAQRYPESPLHEERHAIALLAHCQRAAAGARSLAESFTRRYPGSVYAERIAIGCNSLTISTGVDIDGAKGGNLAQPEDP